MKSNIKPFTGLFLLLILSLASCKNISRDGSFADSLQLIDACIENYQYDDALKLLQKSEKKAMSVQQRLSVAKRYMRTGCNDKAELFLQESLKKLPESKELNAVYCELLMRQNKIEQAQRSAEMLEGTVWAYLYTEYMLRKVQQSNIYLSADYINLYKEAAELSGEDLWYKNAAVLLALSGQLKEARLLAEEYAKEKDWYFWAMLCYDAKDYASCIEYCERCAEQIEAMFLCSDAWLKLGEIDDANNFWSNAIAATSEENVAAGIYKNAARYARLHQNYKKAETLLIKLVECYPDYKEGLVDYARFAVQLKSLSMDDTESAAFRSSGITTLEMDFRDSLPMVPLSDAMYRIENSLNNVFSPELLMEYTRIKWMNDKVPVIKQRQDLLKLLELYRTNSGYEPYICNFAVCWMIQNYYEAEAYQLFAAGCYEKYGVSDLAALLEYFSSLDEKHFTDDMCADLITAAWFFMSQNDTNSAFMLYKKYYSVKKEKGSITSLMNLAALYAAKGMPDNALELYSRLDSATADPVLASEIQCRIGYLQFARKQKADALLSLSYSVSLNPDNHRARLLLKQLDSGR